MLSQIGVCVDCGKRESYDCPLYACETREGHVIVCCIVYAVINSLVILRKIDTLTDYED